LRTERPQATGHRERSGAVANRRAGFRDWQSRQARDRSATRPALRGVGNPDQIGAREHIWSRRSREGQALAELTIGLITFAVLFLSLLVVGDLCRARLAAILEARATVGPSALQGFLSGNATFYGSAADDLQRSVLSAAEDPVAYSQYRPGAYSYMEDNLVAPLQGGTLIGAFMLTQDDASRTVTNAMFLVRMGVGSEYITIRQPVSLPVMRGF
jgi:hypothetical protein